MPFSAKLPSVTLVTVTINPGDDHTAVRGPKCQAVMVVTLVSMGAVSIRPHNGFIEHGQRE